MKRVKQLGSLERAAEGLVNFCSQAVKVTEHCLTSNMKGRTSLHSVTCQNQSAATRKHCLMHVLQATTLQM